MSAPLRNPSPPSSAVTPLRAVGGAAAVVAIVALGMLISHRIADPLPTPEELAAAPAPHAALTNSGLKVSAIEDVYVKVQADGKTLHDGKLCAGPPDVCPQSTLEFPPAHEFVLDVGDLTRVRVVYNGSRVDPLGNLSAPRKLVFIDDQATPPAP